MKSLNLDYMKPSDKGLEIIAKARNIAKEVEKFINENLVDSREASLALTHLEVSTMYAVKAICLQHPNIIDAKTE